MRQLSDKTVCEHLARALAGRGLWQLMLTDIGGGEWHVRATVVDPRDARERFRVRGDGKLVAVLEQLLEHVDRELAAGVAPASPLAPVKCRACGRVGHVLKNCNAGVLRVSLRDDDDDDDDDEVSAAPVRKDPRRGHKIALQIATRLGVVTIDSLSEFVTGQWNRSAREAAIAILDELAEAGELVGDRRGYRLPPHPTEKP